MAGETRETRWTATFGRLPDEKRRRIFLAAKRAFAASGFTGANINRIAEDAGISIGSMYKYFRTKEDLFLALIEALHELIAVTIDEILEKEPGFEARVSALLRAAVESSLADPEAVRLYIACTTEEVAPLASRLSFSIEEVSAERYRRMITEAQARGEVEPSLDSGWAAFFLDNALLLAQFSAGSDYYRERLRLFLGGAPRGAPKSGAAPGPDMAVPALPDDAAWQPEEVIGRLHSLLLRALAPASPPRGG